MGSFLRDREVKLEENGISTVKRTFGGCPRGSCLGPLAWNTISDRILNRQWATHTKIQAFADDFLLIVSGDTEKQLVDNTNESIEIFNKWAIEEHLTINWDKTGLLIVNRPIRYNLRIAVGSTITGFKIGNRGITHQEQLRYLGVTIHNSLKWEKHALHQREKVHKAFRNLQSIKNRKWGIKNQIVKIIWYKTIIEKILLYAAPIWGLQITNRVQEILTSCQRIYALACTKAYRTAPNSAIMVLAGLLPVHLQAQYEAAIGRISRLREVTKVFGKTFYPTEYEEKIKIWEDHPADTVTATTHIENNGIHIFTDGSNIEERTGAAFVAFKHSKIIHTWRAPLNKNNSVFQAELTAIREATRWGKHQSDHITIHTDSKSALQALDTPFQTNRLVREITRVIRETKGKITFNWVKAHVGILGNEVADREAKRAAINEEQLTQITIKKPLSNLKREIKTLAIQEWQLEWDNGTTGRTTHDFLAQVSINRLICSKGIVMTITEHGAFPKYLHRIKRARDEYCACGDVGDCMHYLVDCPLTQDNHLTRPNTNITEWREKILGHRQTQEKVRNIMSWLAQNIDDIHN